jgi:hypothetical protein
MPRSLVAGQLPDTPAPETELAAGEGNKIPSAILPKVAKPGDQVIMRSSAIVWQVAGLGERSDRS